MTSSVHRTFLLVSTGVVVAAVAYGFVIVGSPDWRRVERLDERRVEDLQAIHAEIQDLVRDPDDGGRLRRPLPPSLEELASQARHRRLSLVDPVTGVAYGYAVEGDRIYELCATFTTARDAPHGVFWNHPVGRHCFRIDALDPP